MSRFDTAMVELSMTRLGAGGASTCRLLIRTFDHRSPARLRWPRAAESTRRLSFMTVSDRICRRWLTPATAQIESDRHHRDGGSNEASGIADPAPPDVRARHCPGAHVNVPGARRRPSPCSGVSARNTRTPPRSKPFRRPKNRTSDLDRRQCAVLLREKGQTERWQPISPTLMRHLITHHEDRGHRNPERTATALRQRQPDHPPPLRLHLRPRPARTRLGPSTAGQRPLAPPHHPDLGRTQLRHRRRPCLRRTLRKRRRADHHPVHQGRHHRSRPSPGRTPRVAFSWSGPPGRLASQNGTSVSNGNEGPRPDSDRQNSTAS